MKQWKCWSMALFTIALVRPVQAQQGPKNSEGPTTFALSLGAFSGSFNSSIVRGAISVDHYLGSFVAHAEGLVIPWRTNPCNEGFPRGCSARKYVIRPEIGARFMDRDGNTHPYFGIGIGYVELGFRYDVRPKSGLDVRVLSEILGAGDGAFTGGSSLNVGYWLAVR